MSFLSYFLSLILYEKDLATLFLLEPILYFNYFYLEKNEAEITINLLNIYFFLTKVYNRSFAELHENLLNWTTTTKSYSFVYSESYKRSFAPLFRFWVNHVDWLTSVCRLPRLLILEVTVIIFYLLYRLLNRSEKSIGCTRSKK